MNAIPKTIVEAYFDFRSPFAHIAHARINSGVFEPSAPVRWVSRFRVPAKKGVEIRPGGIGENFS